MSTPKLSERLRAELNEELELLGSMIAAERLTPIPPNRICTDEQLEITHKALDRCIALALSLEAQPDLMNSAYRQSVAAAQVQGSSGQEGEGKPVKP